jgi:hypothetical protein
MKRTAAILTAGALLASGSAWAKDYGDAGTIEIGGNVSFGSSTTKFTETESAIPGDQDTVDETGTAIDVSPEVTFFLLPGLALFGNLGLGMSTTDDKLDDSKTTGQDMRVGVGAGYLLPIGKSRIGPAARLNYISESETDDSGGTKTETTLTGQGVTVAGVAKLPIGGGGVITAALFVDYAMLAADADGAKADVTRTTIGTSVGVSIWF